MSKLLEQINIKNKEIPIGELCSAIFSGGTPSTTNPRFWNGAIPWLSSGETRQDFINETEKKITKDGVENSSTRLALKNDIVIATAGQGLTRGQTSFLNIDTYINQSLISLRANPSKLESEYLYYYLKSKYKKLRSLSDDTSSRGSITIPILSRIKINLPSLLTQKKIAEILSAYDAKIENNNKIIKNLETTAQTIFNEWFVKFKFPGHEKARFIESEMGEIPEGWEVGRIVDLTTVMNSGGTPSTINKDYYGGDISWFSTKELQDGFLFDSEKKITKEGLNNSAAKIFSEKTVVMAIYAAPTVGRLGILSKDSCFNQAAVGLVAKENVGYEFVYLLLKFLRIDLNNMANGAAQQNLNVGIVKNYNIRIPADALLKKFKIVIEPTFNLIFLTQKENISLKSQRDQLLAKLI